MWIPLLKTHNLKVNKVNREPHLLYTLKTKGTQYLRHVQCVCITNLSTLKVPVIITSSCLAVDIVLVRRSGSDVGHTSHSREPEIV